MTAPSTLLGHDGPRGAVFAPALIRLSQAALFAGAYFGAAMASQWLTVLPGLAANFWMPPGVLTAVLLRSARTRWPDFIAAGFLAEVAASTSLYEIGRAHV